MIDSNFAASTETVSEHLFKYIYDIFIYTKNRAIQNLFYHPFLNNDC